MTVALIRILYFALFFSTTYAQVPSGIYFIQKPSKKSLCEQHITMFIGKTKLCISKKAILGIEEIEYVSDILYDATRKVNYISVGLSSSSVSILNKIFQSMPGSQLALVIEDSVIGRFTLNEEVNRKNMLLGYDLNLNNLKIVQARLKKYTQ